MVSDNAYKLIHDLADVVEYFGRELDRHLNSDYDPSMEYVLGLLSGIKDTAHRLGADND